VEPKGVFEYSIIDYPPQDMSALVGKLNTLGSQGWHLVHFGLIGTNMRAVFMREMVEPASTA